MAVGSTGGFRARSSVDLSKIVPISIFLEFNRSREFSENKRLALCSEEKSFLGKASVQSSFRTFRAIAK